MADNDQNDIGSEDVEAELEPWPWDEEGIDQDLVSLADAPTRDSVLRPILMLTVLALGAFIISDWQEELAFFFSSSEPVNLGSVQNFPARAEQDRNWSPDIPHNRLVEVSGIPSKRSIATRYKYFKLVGGEVYIELPREDYQRSAIKRELAEPPKGDIDRSYFSGTGRAVSFAAMPGRYAGLRKYYELNYGTRFCVDVTSEERERLRRKQRDTIRVVHKERNGRLEATGTVPELTEEEIARIAAADPVCVDAWLIQIDTKPSGHWWYLALTGLFVVFMIIDAIFLVRWVINFAKPNDGI